MHYLVGAVVVHHRFDLDVERMLAAPALYWVKGPASEDGGRRWCAPEN